ncbi:MAG: hypothetical protein WBG86_22930 [Polyangiales bacterium]
MRLWLALSLCAWAAPASADSLEEHDFILNCAGCHQVPGGGSPSVPSLHGIAGLPSDLAVRQYLIRVPGVAQAPLSDARLARLMNWVVHRFTGGPLLPPYSEEEVAALRAHPFLDPLAARTPLAVPPAIAR